MDFNNINIVERYVGNPILTGKDFPDEYMIAHCFNSGITMYKDKYLMLCRVEDAALNGFFWVAESDDGYNFTPREQPFKLPHDNPTFVKYGNINCYDPRITYMDGVYYIMHSYALIFIPY